jgi:hypothetical protein
MPSRWTPRSPGPSRIWVTTCLGLALGGAPAAAIAPQRVVAAVAAGAASAGEGGRASTPTMVMAALRKLEAAEASRLAALPALPLRTLNGAGRIDVVPFDGDGALRPGVGDQLARLFGPLALRLAPPGAADEELVPPDPRLVALLMRISTELGGAPITIVSGHRKAGRGTTRRSFHVRGMAADIAVTGRKPLEVRDAALRAGAGGVGLYRAFVHVDVRDEPYRWGGGRAARR